MPEKRTRQRALRAKRRGRSPSTQAGEYVREEIHHVRRGKHGARSTKQAIAIGLSKARRAGVEMPHPERGRTSARTRRQAARDRARGRHPQRRVSPARSRAAQRALEREGRGAASRSALSRQARSAAKKRSASERSASARKGARTRARTQSSR
jgi:hypothetical protein